MSVDTARIVDDRHPAMRALATRRLQLEPQRAVHAEQMFALLQDPALYRFENEAPRSVERLRERFARLESRASGDGCEAWLNWVVSLPRTGLIGFIQATVRRDGSAAVAYVFGSAYWGRGYAFEAVQAMLHELEDRWAVRHCRAVLKRDNARSVRLLTRLGFAQAPHDASTEDIEDGEVLMLRDIAASHPPDCR